MNPHETRTNSDALDLPRRSLSSEAGPFGERPNLTRVRSSSQSESDTSGALAQ